HGKTASTLEGNIARGDCQSKRAARNEKPARAGNSQMPKHQSEAGQRQNTGELRYYYPGAREGHPPVGAPTVLESFIGYPLLQETKCTTRTGLLLNCSKKPAIELGILLFNGTRCGAEVRNNPALTDAYYHDQHQAEHSQYR